MKHTKGPWKLEYKELEFKRKKKTYKKGIFNITSDDLATIVYMSKRQLPVENQDYYNAQLIAAAPEMLEVLEASYEYISECFQGFDEPEMGDPRPVPNFDEQKLLLALKTLINKAKGE